MKTATLIVTLGFLLVVIPCRAAEKDQHQRAVEQRVASQQKRLEVIEQQVAEERQAVERWYAERIRSLQQDYIDRVSIFDIVLEKREGPLTSLELFGLVGMYDGYPSPIMHFYKPPGQPRVSKRERTLRRVLVESYLPVVVEKILEDKEVQRLLMEVADSEHAGFLARQRARRLLKLAEEYEAEAAYYKNLMDARLAALEQRERELKEGVYRVMCEIRAEAEKPQAGVVSAIGYTEKEAYCMVEGVDRILGAGEIIDNVVIKNVKVVGIDRDKVEFEKDGRRWTQKVGQKPKAEYWK